MAHRLTTQNLYSDKWWSRETFRKGKDLDPTTALPQFLAECLLYLCIKWHLKSSTITTYVVVLNSVLADRNMTKILELLALLHSFPPWRSGTILPSCMGFECRTLVVVCSPVFEHHGSDRCKLVIHSQGIIISSSSLAPTINDKGGMEKGRGILVIDSFQWNPSTARG